MKTKLRFFSLLLSVGVFVSGHATPIQAQTDDGLRQFDSVESLVAAVAHLLGQSPAPPKGSIEDVLKHAQQSGLVSDVMTEEPTTGSGSEMLLEAEKREVTSGESVLVPVWLKNAADVANINFTVSYDPDVAIVESELTKGNLLSNALFSNNPRESGLIRVGFAQTSGLNGTGTVAYLPFKTVGRPGSRTALRLAVTTINNPGGAKLKIHRINGSIAIIDPKDRVQGDCDGDGQLALM